MGLRRGSITQLEISKSSGKLLCNFCFILVCLTDWLQRKQIHSLYALAFVLRLVRFLLIFLPQATAVPEKFRGDRQENNNFHLEILIFSDLKKVRFNYH